MTQAPHLYAARQADANQLTRGKLSSHLVSPTPIHEALEQYWGYSAFRPKQEEIVHALLHGRDAAVVMPTGGGKSLCYQLPAVVSGKTCIVISPLIALMQDQAAQLGQMGIPAASLNSASSHAEQQQIARSARDGKFRLIYLSPERLARQDTVEWLRRVPIGFFAIDEAHCISEWGHEFRPEYRQLSRLRETFPDVPIAAFTASATRRVRHDILAQLQLRDPLKVIQSFQRSNLRYTMKQCDSKTQPKLLLATLREHDGNTVIVYAPTIKSVEFTAEWLTKQGIPAIPYHGKMEATQRAANQERWMSDETSVLVGTLAFGLGINKTQTRAVIHLSLPKSIEQYYQEAGRAGRDGEPADCVMLWQKKDAALLAHFIHEVENPAERNRAWERYHAIKQFAESTQCRHRQICEHFGETPKWENCGACDVCIGLPEWLDATRAVEPAVMKIAKVSQAAAAKSMEGVPPALLDRMRKWRREFAREAGLPAFMIVHDATLVELCRHRPTTKDGLLRIHGMGRRKTDLYGAKILAALAAAASDRPV